jgi:hypothetical protein
VPEDDGQESATEDSKDHGAVCPPPRVSGGHTGRI